MTKSRQRCKWVTFSTPPLSLVYRIDLQVSGALENPNNMHNLGMLEDSVNTSVGKQIQLECERLGLQPGDVIDDVIIIH